MAAKSAESECVRADTICRQHLQRKMSGDKLKQGYLQKYAKGSIRDSWQKIYVELYKNSELVWYKKKNDKGNKGSVSLKVVAPFPYLDLHIGKRPCIKCVQPEGNKGSVLLKSVCEFLTVGSYCRAIPYSPQVPSGCSIEHMIAFPQEPNKKSKIHFFLCCNEIEFNEWMQAIGSTLPQKSEVQQGNDAPIVPTVAYNAYAPPPAAAAPSAPCPVSGIGFESLSLSGQPPPYTSSPAPYPAPTGSQPGYPGYPPQQPYPQQQPYSQQPYTAQSCPPQHYPQQPYPQQPYPQQPYPQQPYPQQPYPQQPYPQQPIQQPYYQQPQYVQQGYPRQPHMYAQQPAAMYGAPRTTVIYQTPQPQTVIVTDHRSHGMGNLAAGMLGGAVAGYAAGRMFGGYGYGHGWGRGSWGSCSWGSGSWGSFSGGSWGSFGGFD